MNDNIKLQIREACKQQATTTIEHTPYDPGNGFLMYGYAITSTGEIIMETYEVDKVYNCGCLGCDISTIKTGDSLVGTCADLAFLD